MEGDKGYVKCPPEQKTRKVTNTVVKAAIDVYVHVLKSLISVPLGTLKMKHLLMTRELLRTSPSTH